MNKTKKILLTGANGFLGSNLSHRLIELGYDVLLTDRAGKSVLNHENYIQEDLADPKDLMALLKGIDVVFFFTGKTGPADESFDDPKEFIVGNEVTLTNLLKEVKSLKNKPKIIFPSTRLLYKGLANLSITEDAEKEAKTVYAVNKIACENYLDLYQRCFGIDYVIFRISLPYGSLIPQQKVSYGVMSYLINKARSGESLKIYGSGEQMGTFIHVTDLVNIMIEGALNDKVINDVYNIGGNDNLKMKDAITAIANKFSVGLEQVDWPNVSQFAEHGDLIFDSSKMEKIIDYKYGVTFLSWLKEIKI